MSMTRESELILRWTHMPRRTWLLLLLSVALALAGCGTRTTTPPASPPAQSTATATRPAQKTALQVAAAANLSTALPDLIQAFQRETGIPVTPIVSSSGNLARQIANGAPYDVFLSADEGYVDDLIARGFVQASSKHIYAFGRLALVVNRGSGVKVTTTAGLAAPEVQRIAIANPEHAPYGRAARQALERAGIWPLIEERVVFGENVRQALQFVQSGNATAGLVALSIADVSGVDVYPVREDLYSPVAQAAGIVSRTKHRREAERFLAFLTGPEGRAILGRYGYLFPEGER